jgi:response regulator RpfG family c-di-GMP phosphodiesterase
MDRDPSLTPPAPHVLVVDDEKVIREILADFLSLEGFSVATAPDGLAALERLSQESFDMVISDLKMPNIGGLELLEQIKIHHENVLTVIMTGFGTVETAIEAMKKGAYDYILKPFNVEEVIHIVHRGLETQRLISENIRLREIVSLQELSLELQATLSMKEVLDSTLAKCLSSAGCAIVSICLLNEKTGKYEEGGIVVHPDASPSVSSGILDFDEVFKELKEKNFILLNAPNAARRFFVETPKKLSSFMCIPLVVRQNYIGVLSLYSFSHEVRFTEGQRKIFSMLGSRAAAAIDNAMLFNNLQQTFRQTIQGLARAIEAMDKYTAGHSDRVMLYARITAEEMGESPEQIELVVQAGALHDIGKLGCHANLNKTGKLTREEYGIFKAHPSYGKEILEPITFLHPVIPGVHLHHERWDGKGYPLGLKEEEIPKIARILAVADAYDAMTSNRAYRRALTHDVAVTELLRCSGTQFDPSVVEAFLEAVKKHRDECRRLGKPYPE